MGGCSTKPTNSSRYAVPEEVDSSSGQLAAASGSANRWSQNVGNPVLCMTHSRDHASGGVILGVDGDVRHASSQCLHRRLLAAHGTHLQEIHTTSFNDPHTEDIVYFAKHGTKPPTALASSGTGCVAAGFRCGAFALYSSDREVVHSCSAHSLAVMGVDFSPDGSQAVSGSRDGSVRLLDVGSGSEAWSATAARNLVTCLKWVPYSDSVFAQGAEDLCVRLWDTRSGAGAPVALLEGYTYFPLGLDIDGAGLTLATSSKGFNDVGGEVRLWDLRQPGQTLEEWTPQQVAQVPGHSSDAVDCVWLPEQLCAQLGRSAQDVVASAGKDGAVKLWTVGSEQPLATYRGEGGVAWSCMAATSCDADAGSSTGAPHLVLGSHSGQLQALQVVATEEGGLSIVDTPPAVAV